MLSLPNLPRILFVNPYGIGDVLFTTPAISIVKRHFPKAIIGYLCNERTKVLLETNPLVDGLFVFEKDRYRQLWRKSKRRCVGQLAVFLKKIRQEKFDVVLDYSLNRQFGFFLAALRIPIRIGYSYKNRGIFLNRSMPIKEYSGQSMAIFYCRLLEKMDLVIDPIPRMQFPLGASVKKWMDEFLSSHGIGREDCFIAIHPGGGMSWGADAQYKRWPAESFAKLTKLLREYYGVRILVVGDSSEREIVNSIIHEVGDDGVMNLCGKINLGQLAGLLGRAWFAICNDGGPLHIAVSQGTPTVSFFGPVDESVYGPFPREGHLVLTHPVECRPCYRNFKFPPCPYEHRCLRGLSVEYAFGRIKETFTTIAV